jgi:dephospho-CoA kinase
VIEADRIGHEILMPGGPAFAAVAQRWPQVVVDGAIDRGRLAAIVFSDDDELRELEALTHPLIAAEIARRVAQAGDRDIALELPLGGSFNPSGWTRIVVAAPEEVRLERAVARGMPRDDAADRIATQRGTAGWGAPADVLIENTASLAELEARVAALWEQLAAAE